MLNRIKEIGQIALEQINKANNNEELSKIQITYLSKKSELMSFMQNMRNLAGEERAAFGQLINSVKSSIATAIEERRKQFEEEALKRKLESEVIDITLPSFNYEKGTKHLFQRIIDEVSDVFIGMGYEIAEGPEVELDHFNFELLNVPKDHPARDMQDSFFIDENHLMRSQTSPVQAHVMLDACGKGPIKIISPGKVYRRDDDATHSHQFGQFEGLVIDENVTLSDLKGTLEIMARHMLGEKTNVRFRPSYFPFTEPSFEVDVTCFNCHGNGCNLCKQTGFIELLGAGMVHPNVLIANGYDPEKYKGFAFGTGIDRLAMMKYGITDIRYMYTNDVRFLKQFTRDGE